MESSRRKNQRIKKTTIPNDEINKELQSHKEDIKSLKSCLDSIEVGMNKQ
jgi:hypothetical protein